jgi:predicted Zn-dependent peptidase
MCSYAANFGDWRKLFTQLEEYDKVTADDVQRVARTYLIPDHRTVAYTFVPPGESTGAAGSAGAAEAPEGGQK